ncbi:MAG TPA: hypothetical protein DE036_04295 [Actinobacteria bacterium]|nr:hypothetical protein [Actinomycetota bacterium]
MKKISRLARYLALAASLGTPLLAAAQTGIDASRITQYSDGIIDLINSVFVPVVMAIAFLVFLWGVYKYYIYNADSETERAKGHQTMLWGLIAFVVILSIWGLIAVIRTTFGVGETVNTPAPPIFNVSGGSGGTDNWNTSGNWNNP